MKLFWSSRSPFVRKVMIVAYELGVADRIERIRTLVNPASPNAEVMASHPLSKIPVLVLDTGQAIYDSRVICEYLDAEFGQGSLVPATGPERWQVLTRHAMADALMETCLLWRGESAKTDRCRDDDIISGCELRVGAALDALERDMAPAGAPLRLDQVAVASGLAYLDFRFDTFYWREGRPRLSSWFADFSKRPAFVDTAFADIY